MSPSEQTITCPFCHKEFRLDEAISHKMKEEALEEVKAQTTQEIEAKVKQVQEVEAEKRREIEIELMERRNKEKEFQDKEIELRREMRKVQDEKDAFELEKMRQIDEERAQIKASALKEATEAHRQKDLENEKRFNDLQDKLDEAQRKLAQGSQQTQGEVVELDLEEQLRVAFPLDEIIPIAKGVKGADVLQKIRNRSGHICGAILWESKQAKAWKDEWVTKLKDDLIDAKADIPVIMTSVMPKEIERIGQYNGVWVSDYASAIGLAIALRAGLENVATVKLAMVGKNEKMEAIYNYLSGNEFRQKVEAIVEAFTTMKVDLEKEKKSMQLHWAKRDKQIERVVGNTVSMYGDLQGIIGASLPEIEALEMPELEEGE